MSDCGTVGGVDSAVSTQRGRGRPREFDEDAVLDALVELFWEQGFEAASLSDIVDAAGLNKSSLYNAFGSKNELFTRVIDRYVAGREAMLDQATGGDGGLDTVLDLVDMIEMDSTSEGGRRGCLAINSTAELGFASAEMVEISHRYRAMIRSHIRRPLERAAAAGEISGDQIDTYVDTVMSFMIATSLSARGGASDHELSAQLDSLRVLVRSWRIA